MYSNPLMKLPEDDYQMEIERRLDLARSIFEPGMTQASNPERWHVLAALLVTNAGIWAAIESQAAPGKKKGAKRKVTITKEIHLARVWRKFKGFPGRADKSRSALMKQFKKECGESVSWINDLTDSRIENLVSQSEHLLDNRRNPRMRRYWRALLSSPSAGSKGGLKSTMRSLALKKADPEALIKAAAHQEAMNHHGVAILRKAYDGG